ncbi:MAG: hypothetical protein ACKV1O_13015, partial [Saprospiraceae bacterium]
QCCAFIRLLTIFNPFDRIASVSKNKINKGKPCVFGCNLLIVSVFLKIIAHQLWCSRNSGY